MARDDDERLPDLRVDFEIVGHGYAVTFFADVDRDNRKLTEISGGMRDFGGSHDVDAVRVSLVEHLQEAIKRWRDAL